MTTSPDTGTNACGYGRTRITRARVPASLGTLVFDLSVDVEGANRGVLGRSVVVLWECFRR